jgi:probable F420-dependent oxidoreductase
MEFGWDVPNVHHGFGLDSYVRESDQEGVAVGVETFQKVSARAEEIGFHAIWIADHVLFPESSEVAHPFGYNANTGRDDDNQTATHNVRSHDPVFEALATLSYLAALTTRVRIGIGVLVIPYRNPVLTAKMLATIDVLSGGRIIVTGGVGWLKEAFTALEADYDHRGAVTDEYIELMKVIWTEPRPSYDGQHYQLEPGLEFNPMPVQKPHIPIWIGGVSAPALRRAATHGTGWLGVYQTLEDTAGMHARLNLLLTERDRDPGDFTFAHRLRFQATDHDGGDQPCIGRPQKIADSIRRYHDLGVEHLLLAPPPGPSTAALLEQADRFESQVKPLIEDLWD